MFNRGAAVASPASSKLKSNELISVNSGAVTQRWLERPAQFEHTLTPEQVKAQHRQRDDEELWKSSINEALEVLQEGNAQLQILQ